MASVEQLWSKAQRYLSDGQPIAARIACESILNRDPAHIDARLQLASILLSEHRMRDAAQCLLHAAELPALDAQQAFSVAMALLRVGEILAARDCVERATAAAADSGAACAALARVRQATGEHPQALALLDRAQALGFDSAEFQYFLGHQRLFNGDIDAARAAFESCLRLQPGFGRAVLLLGRLRGHAPEPRALRELQHHAPFVDAGSIDDAALAFARFHALDALGDVAGAWSALQRGNAIMHARLPCDPAYEARLVDRIIARSASLAEAVPEHADAQDAGPQPIFIIGMPRSGTTLLERILGNHSQVAAAGELEDFSRALRWQADWHDRYLIDPELPERLAQADLAQAGRRYLAQTRWRAGNRPRFVDKLPMNYFLAGYIPRALPQARIVHIQREPMDVCFSNYKAYFGNDCAYSYDLTAVAARHRQYQRLMRHWHRLMPGRILEVSYSRLIHAPQTVAREILGHCGLAFEPGCVDLRSNTAPVATLSAEQVQGDIHDRAERASTPYAPYLATLREALAEPPEGPDGN
ncbi:tetratricopeptide repeat-containing sulfotransferase family protein [Rhodanobacter ginsengisoli]|uniref:Tetratricopeptide repeat-containing sulfotransferase family protein n=1 Tax=Rhodanobacter ginsengisoli TaxID=418646 RepID=A0ABW0QQP7_9GAMM